MRAVARRAAALVLLLAAGCDAGAPSPDVPDAPGTPGTPGAGGTPGAPGAVLFRVEQDGARLLIDATGRVVVTLSGYSATRPGNEGLTPARRWTGSRTVWDFFDAVGRVALTVGADEVWAPHEGLIAVRTDGRAGFVDTTGTFVVNPYLYDARPFAGGRAAVRGVGWSWGLIDASGAFTAPARWAEMADLAGGLARVKEGDRYGFVDATGREVIAPTYTEARSFSGGVAAVREGQRWFYVSPGNVRTMGSATFISAGDFADGLAPVRTENLWEYVDATGARVIAPQFEEARAFVDGRAAVRVDGAWTFIDATGARLLAPQFDEVSDFRHGLAAVRLNGKQGYIDAAGTFVWIPR